MQEWQKNTQIRNLENAIETAIQFASRGNGELAANLIFDVVNNIVSITAFCGKSRFHTEVDATAILGVETLVYGRPLLDGQPAIKIIEDGMMKFVSHGIEIIFESNAKMIDCLQGGNLHLAINKGIQLADDKVFKVNSKLYEMAKSMITPDTWVSIWANDSTQWLRFGATSVSCRHDA